MAGLDSLLKMARDHEGDELRLGTDRDPKIWKGPVPVRTTLPATNDAFLRILLEPILTPEIETKLRAEGRVETRYESAGQGSWIASLTRRGNPGPDDPLPFDGVLKKAAIVAPVPPPTASIQHVAMENATGSHATASTATPPKPLAVVTLTQTLTISSELLALLRHARHAGASDLHLMSGEPATIRVDGSLRPLDGPVAQLDTVLQGVLTETTLARLAGGRSMDELIDGSTDGRFRLNVYRADGRLAVAVRLLPRHAPSLDELHMPMLLEDCVAAPHGLVIVCGPTGSGKSATLAALAEAALELSARRGHLRMIMTLEDPVEYVIRGPGLVRQRQIGRDVNDFASGLRDSLREDPDILLIGEMRDPETISLAMTAAETGHLVLSSLHTRSATSTVERIVDSYPAERQAQIRVQLADSLRAVISQRLLRARVGGRVPAIEVLRNTHNVQSMIREGRTAQIVSAVQSGRKEGMLALERSIADLLRQGTIDRDDAFAAANDVGTLQTFLNG